MMIFEMVGDLRFLVPLFLAAALAHGIARRFQPGSAYTFVFPPMGPRLVPGTFTAQRPDADGKA